MRFLNFQISMHCNKNQPNDYIFDYIFCEINWMFGYIRDSRMKSTVFFCILNIEALNILKYKIQYDQFNYIS